MYLKGKKRDFRAPQFFFSVCKLSTGHDIYLLVAISGRAPVGNRETFGIHEEQRAWKNLWRLVVSSTISFRLSSLLSVNGAAVESDGVNSPMHCSICSLFENTEFHRKSGLALNVNLRRHTILSLLVSRYYS